MLVYRVCYESEVNLIFQQREVKAIGKRFFATKMNTHHYDYSKLYIHFYENYDSIFYWYSHYRSFLCTYDIPDYILKPFRGFGMYATRGDRETDHNTYKVPEFAVEADLLDFDYLKKIELMDSSATYEDYLNGDLSDKLELMYDARSHVLNRRFNEYG